VVSHEQLYEDTFLMWLDCPPVARGAAPGRFLMIHCADGYDPLLPRPMSFHRFRDEGGRRLFAILYDVRGRGTAWLSGRQPGDELTVFGPLGRGYALARDAANGHRGPVTDLLAGHLPWADQVFACGPNPMFRTVAEVLRQARSRKPVQALLEERMGCGTGVCYGCAVFTRRGVRLVCKEGPRFEIRDVFPAKL
jgi:NAD(P)H-flavin reductase